MAVFNPDVPDVQPQTYLNLSRPISQPKADESGRYLGEAQKLAYDTIGEGVTVAVKGADAFVKEGLIKPQETQAVDRVRDAFTEELQAYKSSMTQAAINKLPGQVGQPAGYDAHAEATSESLVAGDEESDAPSSVTAGLSQADRLQSALAAKSISQTHYVGQLNAIAKSLRADYPGYRDFIDTEMQRITGMNPANVFINSLREDIHNTAQLISGNKNKIDTVLNRQENLKIDGIIPVIQAYRNGQDPDGIKALTFINQANSDKARYDADKLKSDARKLSDEEQKDSATTIITNRANDLQAQTLDSLNIASGLDEPVKVADFLNKIRNGEIKPTPEQGLELQQKIQQARVDLIRHLREEAYSPIQGKKSLADQIKSPEDLNKLLDQATANLGMYADAFGGKTDWSLTAAISNRITAMRNGDLQTMYSTPGLGNFIRKYTALKATDISPGYLDNLVTDSMRKGYDQKLMNLDLDQKLDIRTQPAAAQGGVNTVAGQLETAAQNGITFKPGTQGAKFASEKLKEIQEITRPDIPDKIKANFVKAFFAPGNIALLDKIPAADYVDPSTKRFIPGKFAAFNTLTAPAISEAVGKLAKIDPSLGEMYRTTVETWFGASLAKAELQKIKTLQEDGVKFKWLNNEKGQYGWQTVPPTQNPVLRQSLGRLNFAINNMAAMHNATGGDTNAYLIQLMSSNGIDVTKASGIPGDMMRAIQASHPPRPENEKPSAARVKKGMEELEPKILPAAKRAADYVFKEMVPELLNPQFGPKQ